MWTRRSFRTCVSLGLAVGGAVFLAYGLFFHVTTISSADDAGAEVWTRAEPVLIQDVTIGQGRPTVEVAQTNVEPNQPTAESDQPAAESDPSTVEVAKQSEPSSGGETEEPKAAPKKEAPKACPT